MIRKPYARVLTGGSTGGWESIALQVLHPDFFGGAWIFQPDPIDFTRYQATDIYADTNAFSIATGPFTAVERGFQRTTAGQTVFTTRDLSRFEAVLGSQGRSGYQLEAWEAVYGPVGADGYPVPLWDKLTGHIDHDVAAYMRDHGYDLRYYLEQNWATIGPKLVGKLHIYCGDMDNFYLNLAVYDLQAFLDAITEPQAQATFHYGRPEKGHGWQHATRAQLVREMAAQITKNAPRGADAKGWKY